MIEVETGIEIQETSERMKYPFRSMDIGASFFVTGKTSSHILSAARTYRPMRFTTRISEKDGVKGVRVWRIE